MREATLYTVVVFKFDPSFPTHFLFFLLKSLLHQEFHSSYEIIWVADSGNSISGRFL